MFHFSGLYTDQYQLTMSQAYFLQGKGNGQAVFDHFFRKLPFGNGYVVFAGLEDLLSNLEQLCFTQDDISYLDSVGFDKNFLDYLAKFKFKGRVYSCKEGEIVFPNEPVLRVEGSIIEAQLIETMLLNLLNFESLIATKASRIRYVAKDAMLVDFGLRRAQGPGGYYASRACMVGGFDGTSNVQAARDFQMPVSGTMAHAYVQSYDNELDAFRDFAENWPDNCVLLVDTYDTVNSGLPNAITVGLEMAARGQQLKGIRLDSGDLAYLAKKSRQMLDEAGLHQVKIAVSNQLDEMVIKSLIEQGAPIDLFGVGTRLVTGQPDAALDGVYKLAYANEKARIKLSESISKVTLPDKKQVYRLLDEKQQIVGGDLVALLNEDAASIDTMVHPLDPNRSMSVAAYLKEPLLSLVFQNGQRVIEPQSLLSINAYRKKRLSQLPEEYQRFSNPHIYKVGLSPSLFELCSELKEKHRS